jgi:hypothetical protein
MLLCELEPVTVGELRTWGAAVSQADDRRGVEVAEGDWRERFRDGLNLPGDLLFVSFDPYMFDRHGPGRTPKTGNMYPDDLDLLATAIAPATQSVIVQVSTYSANNDNAQQAVIETVRSRLASCGLEMTCVTRADGNMMSMVLTRRLAWVDSLRDLPSRFERWLHRLRADAGRRDVTA